MLKAIAIILIWVVLIASIFVISNFKGYDNGYSNAEYNSNYDLVTKKNVIRVTLYTVPESSSIRSEKWMIDKKFDSNSLYGDDAKSMWFKLQDYTEISADNQSRRKLINQDYQLVYEGESKYKNYKNTLLIRQCYYSSHSDDVVLVAIKEDRMCQIILQKSIALKLGIKGL